MTTKAEPVARTEQGLTSDAVYDRAYAYAYVSEHY